MVFQCTCFRYKCVIYTSDQYYIITDDQSNSMEMHNGQVFQYLQHMSALP